MLIVKLLIFLILIEIIIYLLFKILKTDFKWLVDDNDIFANFNKKLIDKYNNEIFDKDLGWDNKKRKKIEKNTLNKKIEYNFDKQGSRITGNKYKYSYISIFGDSYSMSRYSRDNETIQYFAEKKLKKKILNYGVGNYGLDQAFLKMKKKLINKEKVVFIIFVPETILRIQSYWKHFLEFGNTFGFKPKFTYKKGKLILEKDHLQKLKLSSLKNLINNLKKKDFFYENKFKKYYFSFPFSISFIKNLNENFLIFQNLILYKFSKDIKFYNNAINIIILRNIKETQKYYNYIEFQELLKNLILEINEFLIKKKIKPYFVVIPQYLDLKLYGKKSNSSFFFKKLSKINKLNLYDFTKDLIKIKQVEKLYIKDNYGGHLNKTGNKFIANKIINKI